ncbi:MAG: SOS response-associated peptidase family protein, partial [Chitinophagaceae bacterium]|nr:SOS response-associated peptidase family protein [Chitinophagaceae bacterium]
LFCFAGIFSSWTDKETGEHINTFSILTTKANPTMARIHNSKERMPVIIPASLYKKWLSAKLSKAEIGSFFNPYPDAEIAAHTISNLVTSRNLNSNVEEVKMPFYYPELALLK